MGGITLANNIGILIVESFNTLARNISTTIGTYLLIININTFKTITI